MTIIAAVAGGGLICEILRRAIVGARLERSLRHAAEFTGPAGRGLTVRRG